MRRPGTRKWVLPLGAAVFLLLLILLVSGAFRSGTIEPGKTESPAGLGEPSFVEQVSREKHPIWYEAVGTIRSRTQATVASQVTGRVIEVGAEAGESVVQGALIARLDDQEFKARLEQARSGLDAAQAGEQQATANIARIRMLFRDQAATQEQLEVAEASAKGATAGVAAAQQKVTEAQVSFGYTRIESPIAGVVAKREVEPGDLAWPGKLLFIIQHQEDLRLEASVREGLIGEVETGQALQVHLTALDKTVEGVISEIAPSADPVSRSFLVKVSLPSIEGLYPGMYGKLRIRRGDRSTVFIPEQAIRRVGQLTTVRVRTDDRWERRYVTAGSRVGERREILSGLSGGETIGWD